MFFLRTLTVLYCNLVDVLYDLILKISINKEAVKNRNSEILNIDIY